MSGWSIEAGQRLVGSMVFPRMLISGVDGVADLKEISSAKFGCTLRSFGIACMLLLGASKAYCELPMNLL